MKDAFTGEEIATSNPVSSVPLEINFETDETTTFPGDIKSIHPEERQGKREPFEPGLEKEQYHAGVMETAAAQFRNTSSVANVLDYAERDQQLNNLNPLNDIVDPNWNAAFNSDLLNVPEKYKSYMYAATSDKDQKRRYSQVLDLMQQDKLIANGSTLGSLLGGLAGWSPLGSPEMLIPVAGLVRNAKYAKSFLNTIGKNLPGISLSSVAHEAVVNTAKVSGNLEDFVVDSFVDIAFGAAFMGGIALGARAIDSAALWDLRKTVLPQYEGIDFKLKLDEKQNIIGIDAIDAKGALNAKEVSYAQDIANSSFAKMGLFKLPYIGEGLIYTFGVFSPLMRMMNSPYKIVRAITDRAANHSFYTEGTNAGVAAPQKFENLMDQVKGEMTVFSSQITGLHLVRNGQDISGWSRARKQSTRAVKEAGNKLGAENWTSQEDFHFEIDTAVRSGESSPHAAVNEAAGMIRKILDDTYSAWRKAHNLPDTWLPPKTAENYLMRVYNTPYMNLKRTEWNNVVSGFLREADETIIERTRPITELQQTIKDFEAQHKAAINELGQKSTNTNLETGTELIPSGRGMARPMRQSKSMVIPKSEVPLIDRDNNVSAPHPTVQLKQMKERLKFMKEQLQDELRSNPDYHLHIEDFGALSASEAREIKDLTKKLDEYKKAVDEQKKIISDTKKKTSQKLSSAKNAATVEKAKPKSEKYVESKSQVEVEEEKLYELQRAHDEEEISLQERMHNGEINPQLFTKEQDAFIYKFKDPKKRLKFRDVYEDDFKRREAAQAYYQTIMNQTPEQLTGQVMGRLTGSDRQNPLKARSLLIPDSILSTKANPFISTNVVHNVTNYKYFLSRRTFLKNVFNDVSPDGGIEPMINALSKEHEANHKNLSSKLAKITEERNKVNEDKSLSDIAKTEALKKLDKQQKRTDKALIKEAKRLQTATDQLNILYSKMMGTRTFGKTATKYGNMIMAYTAAVKLGFTPFAQITDLSANILQHGLWPTIRDGIIPAIESLGGLLKTKDSEALRRAAPHVDLAANDVLIGHADKNFSGQAQPYFNMGSTIANGLENIAHLSSNLAGTNYFTNGGQHLTGAIAQSTFIEYMYAFKNGTLSKYDYEKILHYGLDPKIWADRFIKEFENAGAHRTKLGGYNSNFWLWKDAEASNKFGDAVFRGIKDTVISRGMLDAPFFMDHPLGAIIMSFQGWTFASLNRYVIPSMQKPNAEKLIGIAFMLTTGALVSPTRRIAAGKSPYPDDVTPEQIMWAAVQDSGYFSIFANILSNINIFTGGTLLGNLKNDRYQDRTMAGLLGASAGIANDIYSILGAVFSGEMNHSDAQKAMKLIPYTQLTEFRALSNYAVDSLEIPKTRAQARRSNAAEG